MVGKAHGEVEEANGRVGMRFHHGWAGLTRITATSWVVLTGSRPIAS